MWPNLLKQNFLEQFITPIVKVFKGKNELAFYSMPDFEEWQRSALNWHTCRVKYYKCGDGCTEEVGHAWKSFVSTQNQSLYLGRCVVGRREAMERDRRNQRHPTQETGSHPSIFIHKKERITLLLAQD